MNTNESKELNAKLDLVLMYITMKELRDHYKERFDMLVYGDESPESELIKEDYAECEKQLSKVLKKIREELGYDE